MVVTRVRVAAVGVALGLVLAVSACSSSGNSSSGSSSEGSSLSASSGVSSPSDASTSSGGNGSQGTPVKVGIVCSCSGTFGAQTSLLARSAQAWAESVNASGGVNGHPINVILKDDASNPGTSVTAAQSLISSHVAVILDSTILDSTWQKQVDAAKIPVVGGNFSTEMYYTDPNWYPTGQTNDSIVYANVATAKAAGGTKIGLLYCAESVQCQESVNPTKSAAQAQGVQLAYQSSISATAPNYTAQCLAAKQAGVNALIMLHSTSVLINVAQDCARQNYTPAVIAEGTGYTSQVDESSGLKDNYWASFPVLPYFASGQQVSAMNKVLDKYTPGMREDTDHYSVVAVQGWTAALAIGKAITASGIPASSEVTPADITKGLTTFSKETLGGWSPPLTFTANKAHPVHCWYTARVQGGKPTLTDSGKLTCDNPSS